MIIYGLVHFGLHVLSQIHVVQVTMYCMLYDGEKSDYYKTSDVSPIYMWSCSVIGGSQTSSLRHSVSSVAFLGFLEMAWGVVGDW